MQFGLYGRVLNRVVSVARSLQVAIFSFGSYIASADKVLAAKFCPNVSLY